MTDAATSELRWDVTTEDGFLACYDHTFAPVYRYVSAFVPGDRQRAEDLVQDVYLGLLDAARSGRVDEVGIGWVMRRARHRFLDTIRSAGREERRLRAVDAEPRAAAETDIAGFGDVLAPLSDDERAALVFRYVDDLPVPEVAELLGRTVRATESLLQRAKRKARAAEEG